MSLSHIEFNEQVTSFASDVSNAISALKNGDGVQVDAELASADIRLRAVVNAKVDLCSRSELGECLAELHLYARADHDDEMAALGALAATPKYHGDNVIPLHG